MVSADREPDPQHFPTFYSADFNHGVWSEHVMVCRVLGRNRSRRGVAGRNLSAG